MGDKTYSTGVSQTSLIIVVNGCCPNPFFLVSKLFKYKPEVFVSIEKYHTLCACMEKSLGPSAQFYRSTTVLLTTLSSVEPFTSEVYLGLCKDGKSSWTIRTKDKSDVVNKWLMAQLWMIKFQ